MQENSFWPNRSDSYFLNIFLWKNICKSNKMNSYKQGQYDSHSKVQQIFFLSILFSLYATNTLNSIFLCKQNNNHWFYSCDNIYFQIENINCFLSFFLCSKPFGISATIFNSRPSLFTQKPGFEHTAISLLPILTRSLYQYFYTTPYFLSNLSFCYNFPFLLLLIKKTLKKNSQTVTAFPESKAFT